MGTLYDVSQQFVKVGIAGCALLLALGIALGGFESQLGALLGSPSTGQAARGRVIVLALTLAVAALATPAAREVAHAVVNSANVGAGMAHLVKLIVDALIVLGALLLALGFAAAGVGAQVAALSGLPRQQAELLMRLLWLVASFVVIVAAIPLANAMIDAVVH